MNNISDNRKVKSLKEDIELILDETNREHLVEDLTKFVVSKQLEPLDDVRDKGYGLLDHINSLNNQLYILNEQNS